MGKDVVMKNYPILYFALLVFALDFSGACYAADKDEKSIGTVAGETARDLTAKTEETIKVASVETQKASKQVEQAANEAFQKLSVQTQDAFKDFQVTAHELSKQLQKEWEKFLQAYQKQAKT